MKKKRLWILIIAAAVLIYFIWILVSQQMGIYEREKKIAEIQSEIDKTNKESDELRNEIENANERETIEKIAREDLGLVYPDERTYVDSNG